MGIIIKYWSNMLTVLKIKKNNNVYRCIEINFMNEVHTSVYCANNENCVYNNVIFVNIVDCT